MVRGIRRGVPVVFHFQSVLVYIDFPKENTENGTNPPPSSAHHHSHSVYNRENGPALAGAVGRKRSNGRVLGRGGIAVARVVGWRGWLGRFVVVVLPFCLLFFPIDLVYVLFFCGWWMDGCLSVPGKGAKVG